VLKRNNLSNLIYNCIAQLTHKTVKKDIDVKVDVPENYYIQADERLISKVFINLIDNAVKFSENGSVVAITANEFKKGFIEITIKDDGNGIEEKNFEKLFRIDEKFASEGTHGEKGSGLGLTIVKEILDRHNGNIWFYSTINEGSEFHLTLPEAKKTVVLVEDEENIRNIYKRMISKVLSDYEVVEAENGYEAINIINKKIPSLIITDHDMPLMNGIKFVEGLRKRDANFSIPVIVVSAKLTDEIISSYKELGVFNLLEKPFDKTKLEESLLEIAED
jgi:CheY-like chemotaxis protein